MATNPLSGPKARYLDSSGNPLSGGKLYSYSAGTGTPRATYTTRAGSVANANPVILDANGEADVWLTAGVDYKFSLYSSTDVLQWTVDNFPSPAETSTTDSVVTDPGGRLTVTSLTPVTTSDATGGTVYYTPYRHDKVPLYDGTAWALHSIATELSQATSDATKSPSAAANNANYDIFVWNDSGTLRATRGPAWTSDTARGSGAGTTELERLNGRLVNKVSITNGPAAQRGLYVGSIRNTVAGVLDTLANRLVWNMYHRILRPMRVLESTNNWIYSSATWRQANGVSTNQLAFLQGISEDLAEAHVHAHASGAGTSPYVGVGLDSTTAIAAGSLSESFVCVASEAMNGEAMWKGHPGLGYHYLTWLERSDGAATTFRGNAGAATSFQCGIQGSCLA